MAYCIKCGKELVAGAHFCDHCGHAVGTPLEGDDAVAPAQPQPRPAARQADVVPATILPPRQRTPEELEELGRQRLPTGRAILSLLVPPAGVAFTIVNFCTHRRRAGRQALICTIIGFAIWTALYVWRTIGAMDDASSAFDRSFDWYDL